MPNKYKELVVKLFQESAKNDKNTRTLAREIGQKINSELSGGQYVNELLQNADDAGSNDVEFIITQDYLIFSHGGKHFAAQEVEAISDAAHPDRSKVSDLEAIGHKGIGFKAVFSFSDYVLISSQNYHFRFDKSFKTWAQKSQDYPWQIIPIWTEKEEFPEEVKNHLNEQRVNFIFKLSHKAQEICQHIKKIQSSPQRLLFLKNIRQFTLRDLSLSQTIQLAFNHNAEEKVDTLTIKKIELKENDLATKNWLVFKTNYNLIKKKLYLINTKQLRSYPCS